MAATGVKALFKFQDDNFGISEFHICNFSNPQQAVATAVQYMQFRMLISGFNVVPIGITLSQLGQFRNALEVDPGQFAGLTPTFQMAATPANPVTGQGVSTVGNEPDQAKSCALLTMYGAANQTRKMFLAGIPDFVIREDPRGPTAAVPPQWLANFNGFKNNLIANWGFISTINAPGGATRYPIYYLLGVDAQNNIGIAVSTALVTFTFGQQIQLRNFKMTNRAYKNPNGKWVIGSVSAPNTPQAGYLTYYLQGSSNINVNTIQTVGTVNATASYFIPYTSVSLSGETTRKRGNRFLAPLGRRKVAKYV